MQSSPQMSISAKKRRVIFALYSGLFIVLSPIFLAYTAGIRWTPALGFVKTGTFYVASTPSGAKISVNGKNTGEKTPSVLKHILPGTYDIALEKDNAITWSKKLPIRSGETTFVNDAYLFKKDAPELVVQAKIDEVAFGDDTVAWTTVQSGWREVWLSEISNPRKILVYRSAAKSRLGLRFKDRILIVGEGEADGILSFNSNGTPASYKPILVFVNRKNRTDVYGSDETNKAPALSLPSGNWNEADERNDIVIATDKRRVRLAVIDSRQKTILLQTAASLFDFANDDILLFASDTELSMFNIPQNKVSLIERFSSPPTRIQIHQTGNLILLESDGVITAIETDERDGKRKTELVSGFSVIGFSIGDSGRTLYIAGSYGTDEGIFVKPLY
ncbi:MAG: PEGA domain-containing protein [Patescibacteria group bacterium]